MNPARRLHLWHPFTQEALDPEPLVIERAEGVHLHTACGRTLVDGISSWWVNLHGHGHPRIASAIAEQARGLQHVLFAGFSHTPALRLAQALGRVLPAGLEHVFFSDNGSTAVETALKMALQFWSNHGQPQRNRIIALEHAYHGDTAGAMSAGDDSPFTAPFQAMRFPVLRAHSAYCHRCPVGKERSSCDVECLDRLEDLLERHGDQVAALILEPLLQGAGGMIVHPPEFLRRIAALLKAKGILFIADEVFTGFGRTGAMFACELAGVVPDILCLSKGLTGGALPLAVTVTSGQVHEAFLSSDRRHTFFHGHSYTANPIGCAAALANLEIFATEPVFERIETISRIHRERLAALERHPAVADARMLGTVAALEIEAGDSGYLSALRPRLYAHFLDRGVLLRPLGNVVYLAPPYAITPSQLHFAWDAVAGALDLIQRPASR